jgi:serine protein kinase
VPESEAQRLHAESGEEGMNGSRRASSSTISNAITRGNTHSLTSMELLLALKDAIENDARMDAKQKRRPGSIIWSRRARSSITAG